MTEIVVNTSPYIYFDVYGVTAAGTPTAVLDQNGVTGSLTVSLSTGQLPSTALERWQTRIPYAATQQEQTIKVVWSATFDTDNYSKTDYFDVVTPYTTPEDLVWQYGWSLDPTSPKYRSREELLRAERVARYVIETYTQLSFGKESKTTTVYGNAADVISLGEPIAEITELRENGVTVWKSDGSVSDFGYDIETTETAQGIRIVYNGYDIQESTSILGRFKDGYRYDIVGIFGFSHVPSAVSEAAALLVNDYMQKDAAWRARYLTDVTIRDWAFKIGDGAFSGTGNLIVDQLLDPWLAPWIAVI